MSGKTQRLMQLGEDERKREKETDTEKETHRRLTSILSS